MVLECRENRGNENRAKRVWLAVVSSGFVIVRVGFADETTQGAVHAGCAAELRRERSHKAVLIDSAAVLLDTVQQHLRDREMLQECYDVGERFMERQHVGIGGFLITGM